jgi:hypothetical protein
MPSSLQLAQKLTEFFDGLLASMTPLVSDATALNAPLPTTLSGLLERRAVNNMIPVIVTELVRWQVRQAAEEFSACGALTLNIDANACIQRHCHPDPRAYRPLEVYASLFAEFGDGKGVQLVYANLARRLKPRARRAVNEPGNGMKFSLNLRRSMYDKAVARAFCSEGIAQLAMFLHVLNAFVLWTGAAGFDVVAVVRTLADKEQEQVLCQPLPEALHAERNGESVEFWLGAELAERLSEFITTYATARPTNDGGRPLLHNYSVVAYRPPVIRQ